MMADTKQIPVFPLNILPLPQELVPLHIFELRYRQLLKDIQQGDGTFGIYLDHPENKDHIGSIVRLEKVFKKYDTGESDIVVECVQNFILEQFQPTYPEKLYPGGKVHIIENTEGLVADEELQNFTNKYLFKRDGEPSTKSRTLHEIANLLQLETQDRIRYIKSSKGARAQRLIYNLVKYNYHLLELENKSKTNFHLN